LKSKPLAWTSGIGEGKDWDKVAGYWRFSDAVKPGADQFVSSGAPPSRLMLLDLSKFGAASGGTAQALELYCPNPSNIILEASTSPVDPGEDHEKVKALYDVIYRESASHGEQEVVQGLRTVVGRGSPLDIGFCHVSSERLRMTVEMWVKYDAAGSAGRNSVARHTLMMRCVGGPSGCVTGDGLFDAEEEVKFMALKKDLLWCLLIDEEGRLCWTFGDILAASPVSVCSANRCGPIMDSNQWVHIACTIDSAANHSNQWPTSSAVSLLVNGECVVSGSVGLSNSKVTELDLAISTLYFGPNLSSGWSLTELRVWADVRTVSDIDSQKENHLALASKRKRLQSRIKGGKKMFSALVPASLVVGACAAETTPLVSVLKKLSGKVEDEEQPATTTAAGSRPTNPVSGGTEGGVAAKATLGLKLGGPGLAPLGATNRRGSNIGQTATPLATVAGTTESATPAVSTQHPVADETKPVSLKSSSGLTPPLAAVAGSGGMSAAARARRASTVQSSGTTPIVSAKATEGPTANITPSMGLKTFSSESVVSSSTVSPSVTPPPSPAIKPSTSNAAPAGSVLAVVHRLMKSLDHISDAGLDTVNLLHQVNSKPLPHFGAIPTIIRDHPLRASQEASMHNVYVANAGTSITIAPFYHDHIYLELPICAESAIVNNFAVSQSAAGGSNSGRVGAGAGFTDIILAVAYRNEIKVYACSTACLNASSGTNERLFQLITVQPATPIAYWSFVGLDSIFILGTKAGYSWKIRVRDEGSKQLLSPDVNNNKPNKLFERFDVLPTVGARYSSFLVVRVQF
jgi:hypothetical protein